MKYVWIYILIMIDLLWFIAAIKDIIRAIHVVKKAEEERVEPYTEEEFKDELASEFEESTVSWFIVNIAIIFIISFVIWIKA